MAPPNVSVYHVYYTVLFFCFVPVLLLCCCPCLSVMVLYPKATKFSPLKVGVYPDYSNIVEAATAEDPASNKKDC
jgi:hypothetical protein